MITLRELLSGEWRIESNMFDAEKKLDELIIEIREWFQKNGPQATAVLGISGGKDSTVAAAVLARALGKDRVLGVMMPCNVQKDIDDSRKVVEALGIRALEVNIGTPYDTMLNALDVLASDDAKVNLQPRLRMAALYLVAHLLLFHDAGVVALRTHGIVGIGHSDNAGFLRYGWTCKAIGITTAVIALMVPSGANRKSGDLGDVLQDLSTEHGMLLHKIVLILL